MDIKTCRIVLTKNGEPVGMATDGEIDYYRILKELKIKNLFKRYENGELMTIVKDIGLVTWKWNIIAQRFYKE